MALKVKTTRREREDREEALRDVVREEMTRLNALIPISLHKRLKMQAAKMGKGMTITSILIEALEAYMSQLSSE